MDDLKIILHDKLPTSTIEHKWRELEQRSDQSFFLSWYWIGTWLKTINKPWKLLEVISDGQTVGLGILVEHLTIRNGVIISKRLLLHRTDIKATDQIWIEYNDFLIQNASRPYIRQKITEFLIDQTEWDELIIGVSTKEVLQDYEHPKLVKNIEWATTSYQVDLNLIRENEKPYLNTLSRNTRYQIRKSLKSYQEFGAIKIDSATNIDQAMSWLKDVSKLHIKRWNKTKIGSGFVNNEFVNFHKKLMTNCFKDSKFELLKVTAGEHVVGFLYNFIYNQKVRFYLSSFNYENNENGRKPGLLTHYLAIEHYLKKGFSLYDFMGGNSRYKRSFCTTSFPVYLAALQKNKFKFKLERGLRKLKAGWQQTVDTKTVNSIKLKSTTKKDTFFQQLVINEDMSFIAKNVSVLPIEDAKNKNELFDFEFNVSNSKWKIQKSSLMLICEEKCNSKEVEIGGLTTSYHVHKNTLFVSLSHGIIKGFSASGDVVQVINIQDFLIETLTSMSGLEIINQNLLVCAVSTRKDKVLNHIVGIDLQNTKVNWCLEIDSLGLTNITEMKCEFTHE